MADTKISALTAATTPLAGTELVPIVQGGASKKVAQSDLAVPADGSITGAKIASAIKDAAAGTASLRTLGTSSTSAMAGDKNLATIAAPSADVDLNSKKITSLANPTSAQDGATKTYTDSAAANAAIRLSNQSTSVVDTMMRPFVLNNGAQTSGTVYFTFFTPVTTLTVTQISLSPASSTSSGLTLARIGLYTVDSSDNATLVARTANDTTLFNSNTAVYTRSFDTTGGYPSSYTLTAGDRYAVAVIQVGTTIGSITAVGVANSFYSIIQTVVPRVTGSVGSQTDLPTSRSSYTAQSMAPWFRLS